jgi:toxin FitB
MNWLLDTNIISESAKKNADERVIAWLRRERANSYTSSIVISQLAHWVRTKRGTEQKRLQEWLTRLLASFGERVLNFTTSTAHVWADMHVKHEKAGKAMPVVDSYIAATAIQHGLVIVSDDADFRDRDFKVFNPFEEL